jgi:MFS transporter, FHS family, L-fucose permease
MSNLKQQQGTHPSFFILIIVFFFWGFVAASNGIFIPFCKTHFHLSQFESQLIDTAFYGAYYIGSLIVYLLSVGRGEDIINKIGYKNGIIYGLFISIGGALLMIPAIGSGAFSFILGAFFVVALGFSLQQTCAQPFAAALGEPASASHRLNMAGGVNSLGTTLGPLIVSFLLFGSIASHAEADISAVNTLYLILAGVFGLAAVIFWFAKLPRTTSDEAFEKTPKATNTLLLMTGFLALIILIGMFTELSKLSIITIAMIGVLVILLMAYSQASRNPEGWGAMQYPQLVLGMIGIFVYVGVEVTIQSNFGALLKLPEFGGFNESQISRYISLYWGSMMVGRWMGGIAVFNLQGTTRKVANVIVPFLAFAIVLGVNALKGNEVGDLTIYAGWIVVLIIAIFWGQEQPVKTQLAVSVMGIVAMLIGIFSTGLIATFAFIAGGLCCSVMWPCIFSLAIAGLGKYTSQGSSLLIMMILGGALIPPMQGGLADVPSIGIHASYWLAVICFGYLAWFAIKVKDVLKRQGIDYEQQMSGGH